MTAAPPAVAIVLLNWNRWDYTTACLESLFKLATPNVHVIVCDNNSSDGSMARLQAWAAGNQPAPLPDIPELRTLVEPAIEKPVACRVLDRATAESNHALAPIPLTLIQTGANLGFAGGCNVGARYALAQGVDYIWFLNNDTLVTPESLLHLLEHTEAHPEIALCGSTLRGLHHPQRILALGGARLHPQTGTTGHVGEGLEWPPPTELVEQAEAAMDYVVGASMLARRAFIEAAGLMAEDYFLYYEELDWAQRVPAGMRLGYAPRSVVHHVEGGTTGGLLLPYYYRSLLRFNWRHNRANFSQVLRRMLRRVPDAVRERDWAKLRALASLLLPRRLPRA